MFSERTPGYGRIVRVDWDIQHHIGTLRTDDPDPDNKKTHQCALSVNRWTLLTNRLAQMGKVAPHPDQSRAPYTESRPPTSLMVLKIAPLPHLNRLRSAPETNRRPLDGPWSTRISGFQPATTVRRSTLVTIAVDECCATVGHDWWSA